MRHNKWKFVGGTKRPRRNLEDAISAIEKSPDGESAIYNSETGEMYSIKGELLVPMSARQTITIARALAVVVVSDMAKTDVPKDSVMQLIAKAGEPVHGLVVSAAREIIASMQAGGEDGSSGSEVSEEPV